MLEAFLGEIIVLIGVFVLVLGVLHIIKLFARHSPRLNP